MYTLASTNGSSGYVYIEFSSRTPIVLVTAPRQSKLGYRGHAIRVPAMTIICSATEKAYYCKTATRVFDLITDQRWNAEPVIESKGSRHPSESKLSYTSSMRYTMPLARTDSLLVKYISRIIHSEGSLTSKRVILLFMRSLGVGRMWTCHV